MCEGRWENIFCGLCGKRKREEEGFLNKEGGRGNPSGQQQNHRSGRKQRGEELTQEKGRKEEVRWFYPLFVCSAVPFTGRIKRRTDMEAEN